MTALALAYMDQIDELRERVDVARAEYEASSMPSYVEHRLHWAERDLLAVELLAWESAP